MPRHRLWFRLQGHHVDQENKRNPSPVQGKKNALLIMPWTNIIWVSAATGTLTKTGNRRLQQCRHSESHDFENYTLAHSYRTLLDCERMWAPPQGLTSPELETLFLDWRWGRSWAVNRCFIPGFMCQSLGKLLRTMAIDWIILTMPVLDSYDQFN